MPEVRLSGKFERGKVRLVYGCSKFPKCRFTESYYACEGEEWNIDWYEEYLLNRELDVVVMESEHGDWGCRDE